MVTRRASSKLILVFINLGILLGMVLACLNYRVDRLSLFAVGVVSLLVLNGMFFAVRKSETFRESA